ncbi:MAG: histidinol-phosphate transaminase, partial [Gammaproteobacteria bacterium]
MTDSPFHRLAVSGVLGLHPYQPGKPLSELEREYGIRDAVKLASNENPLGPSTAVREALEHAVTDVPRYPDGNGFALKAALSARHGWEPSTITLGNGSNDVLDMVARAFLGPGREAVFSEHAFVVYPIATQAVGATARVAKARDHGHDLDAMAALVSDRTSVVFIANPNNPTGTWLRAAELEAFIAGLPDHVICVVDEAYFEYVDEPDYPDASQWLERFPRLIVTRTFSKAYGLAALRVGFGISHPDVADLLNRVRHPFNVNEFGLAAAVAALGDEAHLRDSVALNTRGRARLGAAFEGLGLSAIESVGNFITVDVGRGAA